MDFTHSHFCKQEKKLVTCSDEGCKEFTVEKCPACLQIERDAQDQSSDFCFFYDNFDFEK